MRHKSVDNRFTSPNQPIHSLQKKYPNILIFDSLNRFAVCEERIGVCWCVWLTGVFSASSSSSLTAHWWFCVCECDWRHRGVSIECLYRFVVPLLTKTAHKCSFPRLGLSNGSNEKLSTFLSSKFTNYYSYLSKSVQINVQLNIRRYCWSQCKYSSWLVYKCDAK